MEELEVAVYRINKLVLLYGNDFEHSAMDIIRKELSGSGQNSAEKAQPEGEHNTSSPKLPSLMECAEKLLGGKLTSYPPTDYSDGMKDMYNFLVGNFGLR